MEPKKSVIQDYLAENGDDLATGHPTGKKHFRAALLLLGVFLMPSVKPDANEISYFLQKLMATGPLLYFLMNAYGRKPSAVKAVRSVVCIGAVGWLIILLLIAGNHFGYFGSANGGEFTKHFYANVIDLSVRTLVLLYAFWVLFISKETRRYLANE